MDSQLHEPIAAHVDPAPHARHEGSRAEAELQELRQYQALTVLLQGLRSRQELRFVLALHLERLFPQTSGALYLVDPANRGQLSAIAQWGAVAETDDRAMPACVAQHLDDTASLDSLLTTIVPPPQHDDQGVCAPLMAEGELLGVLYASADAQDGTPNPPLPEPARRRLVEVADRLVLPLTVMQMRERLRDHARLDPLTGVPNRTQMDATIAQKVAEAGNWGADLTVAVIDLDHFTMVNLSAGHDAGDHFLTGFAHYLRNQFDTDDALLRLGGDEFVIVMPATDAGTAKTKLEEAHAKWLYETPAGSGGHTFSAGVADTKVSGTMPRELLRAAHKALSDAKAAGRARVHVFAPVAPPVQETSFLKQFGVLPGV